MDIKIVAESLIKRFNKQKIDFAFIGGVGVNAAGFVRATNDVDFMVLLKNADAVGEIMKGLDYKELKKTEDFASYISDIEIFGRVDFLYAHRKYSLDMLGRAKKMPLLDGALEAKVLDPEDIIGLKVQSVVNNPDRLTKDMLDILNILKINKNNLNMKRIAEYFSVFDMEEKLKDILKELEDV